MATLKNAGMDAVSVPLDKIDEMKFQPKEREEGVIELAEDIDERGLLYPIRVAPYIPGASGLPVKGLTSKQILASPKCRYLICDGHRRCWAYQHLKRTEIPSLLTFDLSTLELFLMWARANSKRLNPDPYSMAKFVVATMEQVGVEYPQYAPDEVKREALRMLVDATGYSEQLFKSRLAIFSAPKAIQRMIEKESSRANLPVEVNNSIPEKFRGDVYGAYVKGELVSTLEPRVLGKELKAIDADDALTASQKTARAKAVIRTFRNSTAKRVPTNTRVNKYLSSIDSLRRIILTWNLSGLTPQQLNELTSAVTSLQVTFRELRRQNGVLPRGK